MSSAQEIRKNRIKNGTPIEHVKFDEIDGAESMESYYSNILSEEEIELAVKEYGNKIDTLYDEFDEKTSLNKRDKGFLIAAIILQCARMVLVTWVTKRDVEGKSNLEKKLKEKEKKSTKEYKKTEEYKKRKNEVAKPYYAPLNQIKTTLNVPYDTQKFMNKKNNGMFKGGNHRFSTLGHDPILGLVFGTVNIMTNTITDSNKKSFHVCYDSNFKNPEINPEGGYHITLLAMEKAASRSNEEKEALVAAFIKQIMHIGTDVFTRKGIPLPGLQGNVSTKDIEQLTKYIDWGDILKFGTSSVIDIFINLIISLLHGSSFLWGEKREGMDVQLHKLKTKKIITYSNVIATSSNVIYSAISRDIKNLDLGGMVVTLYNLFDLTNFYDKLLFEFVNSNLREIYQYDDNGIL